MTEHELDDLDDIEITVSSTVYKHEDTCEHFSPSHEIPEEVAEVVEAFDEPVNQRAVAVGCNTCSSYKMRENPEVSRYVYYVAQSEYDDGVYFGYGGSPTPTAVAEQLVETAEKQGVNAEWDGDPSTKVLIGGDDWEARHFGITEAPIE
jgi:hypothetical protein